MERERSSDRHPLLWTAAFGTKTRCRDAAAQAKSEHRAPVAIPLSSRFSENWTWCEMLFFFFQNRVLVANRVFRLCCSTFFVCVVLPTFPFPLILSRRSHRPRPPFGVMCECVNVKVPLESAPPSNISVCLCAMYQDIICVTKNHNAKNQRGACESSSRKGCSPSTGPRRSLGACLSWQDARVLSLQYSTAQRRNSMRCKSACASVLWG